MGARLRRWMMVGMLAGGIFGACMAQADDSDRIRVGQFSRQTLDGWHSKKFINETLYSLATVDGDMALQAISRSSASGLIKKIQVDLETYPFLNWRWRIENRLSGSFDETRKTGDDYAARVYVVVSGGLAVWNTQALNYVWARNARKGEPWPNAFAGKNAVMVALRSGPDPVSVWQKEKRNVYEDFKRYFGKAVRFVDAIVVMTDTDNTGGQVTAYYGDIEFSRH